MVETGQVQAVKARLFALALVGIAIVLLVWSVAAPWGAGWSGGRRYKLHLWGVAVISNPNSASASVQSCDWFGLTATPEACARADGAGARYVLLALALPAMLLSCACALVAALLIARGTVAGMNFARWALPLLMAATVLVFASILLLSRNVQGAVRVFQSSVVGFEGTGLAAANAGMVALAIALLVSRSFRARPA